MPRTIDFDELKKKVSSVPLPARRGRVTAASELVIEAELPGARIGMGAIVERGGGEPVPAEVASCDGSLARLLPLAPATGVGPGEAVELTSTAGSIPVGEGLLGRILSPLGETVDSGPTPVGLTPWALERPAPDPLARRPVDTPLQTGIRAIDGCLTLGLGQRIGLFAGPGLGKSTLLGALAARSTAHVSVICLVGERGREVREFLDRNLGPAGLARSVVILAPADAPPLVRSRALGAATAVAEWFRAEGRDVLLAVDSLTRVVRARRDVALSLGEPPARGGYPASSFAGLPPLLERTGRDHRGSITAIYAVLTEGTGDDPVAEEARSLLDGHLVLSPRLARAGRWPAVDVTRSVSRVMDAVISAEHRAAAGRLGALVSALEEHEDLILMGAYRRGTSPDTDLAIDRKQRIDAFFRQELKTSETFESTVRALTALIGPA